MHDSNCLRPILNAPGLSARQTRRCASAWRITTWRWAIRRGPQGELAGDQPDADSDPDYRYLLAEANVYRQQHHNTEALTAFAQASDAAGEDPTAQEGLLLGRSETKV